MRQSIFFQDWGMRQYFVAVFKNCWSQRTVFFTCAFFRKTCCYFFNMYCYHSGAENHNSRKMTLCPSIAHVHHSICMAGAVSCTFHCFFKKVCLLSEKNQNLSHCKKNPEVSILFVYEKCIPFGADGVGVLLKPGCFFPLPLFPWVAINKMQLGHEFKHCE